MLSRNRRLTECNDRYDEIERSGPKPALVLVRLDKLLAVELRYEEPCSVVMAKPELDVRTDDAIDISARI